MRHQSAVRNLVVFVAVVLALPSPAVAVNDFSDVGLVEGFGTIGDEWANGATSCSADGDTWTGGQGLYSVNGLGSGKHRNFGFGAAFQGNRYTADLTVCGRLGPVAGVGASCLASKGHSGQGKAVIKSDISNLKANQVLRLRDIGWKAAPGGTLLVLGRFRQDDFPNASGQLLALLQVVGLSSACLDDVTGTKGPGRGLRDVNLLGVAALLQTVTSVTWNQVTDAACPKADGDPCPVWDRKEP